MSSQTNNDDVASDDWDRRLLIAARTSSSRSYTVLEVVEDQEEDEREMKKQTLKQIVKHKDLKALHRFGGVLAAQATFLPSHPHVGTANDGLMGLSVDSVPELRFWDSLFPFSKAFWYSVWLSFNTSSIFLLIIAAGLAFAIGSLEQGHKYGWHDGVGILTAVVLLVFFPSVFDFYRKRVEEKKLLKIKNNLEVIVERGELLRIVSVSDVKEGEIIHLKKGDRVPADGLMIRGTNLTVDEVINSKIDPDRNPFLFSGSVVAHGNGVMIVVSTGADMAFGKGLIDATSHPSQETLLQSLINKPYEFIGMFSLRLSVIVLIVILARLRFGEHDTYYNDKPANKGKVTMGIMENVFERTFLKFRWPEVSFLVTALLTMVIGIQHGMPFSISISLSWWGEKIRRSHGGKSQNLSACGTLGLVSVICIDITGGGGLSCDEIEVDQFWIGEKKIYRGMKFHPDVLKGLEQAARDLCFYPKTSVHLRNILLRFWANLGLEINIESLDQKFDIIDSKIFRSKQGIGALMSKSENFEANLHLHYNGDALTILNMCSQYYDSSGRIHDMENQRGSLEKVINDMIIEGLRPMAFACKETNHHQLFDGGGLKLLGFVGLKYSFQKIKMALKDLNDVGIRIVLTSEDELSVATAMAVDLELQCGNNQVIEGKEFRKKMESAEMEKNELMKSITLMGKATPEDKLLLLQELKTDGHVVAFLGGFTTSDAPTLREADVGVTEENLSTEVSRIASDITVSSTTSLNKILRCGRCAYLNIQKFYQVQYTTTISGLLIILVCNMVSGKSPITAIHLIWIPLITCLLGSPMMVMELNREEVKIPLGGDRNQSLITKVIWKKIVIHVLCQALLFLPLEYLGKTILPHMEEDVRHTMLFNSFILWQICNLFSAMGLVSNRVLVFKAMRQSPWFLIFLASVLTVQVMVIEFAAKIVNGVKMNAMQWAICSFFASLRLTLEWTWIIFFPVLATLLSEFDHVDFNFILMLFASLMFIFSVIHGFHLFP